MKRPSAPTQDAVCQNAPTGFGGWSCSPAATITDPDLRDRATPDPGPPRSTSRVRRGRPTGRRGGGRTISPRPTLSPKTRRELEDVEPGGPLVAVAAHCEG